MPKRRRVSRFDTGLRRQLLQRRDGNHAAGQYLLCGPGVLLLAHRLGRSQAFLGAPGVGGCDDARDCVRPLPKHRKIDAERLADTAQRVLDLAVHLGGSQVDESRGEIGDERLELEKPREALCGGLRPIGGFGHAGRVYRLRTGDGRSTRRRHGVLLPPPTALNRGPSIRATGVEVEAPLSNPVSPGLPLRWPAPRPPSTARGTIARHRRGRQGWPGGQRGGSTGRGGLPGAARAPAPALRGAAGHRGARPARCSPASHGDKAPALQAKLLRAVQERTGR